jgi:hypothetical protein
MGTCFGAVNCRLARASGTIGRNFPGYFYTWTAHLALGRRASMVWLRHRIA